MTVQRYRCDDCGLISVEADIDKVQDPKPRSTQVWWVCPHCRAADKFGYACNEPGCAKWATIGTPTPDGYQHFCGQHGQPFLKVHFEKQETLK
jgi:rubredoxin